VTVLPKSPIRGRDRLYPEELGALLRYCRDGDLEIDNNGAERSPCSIVVGRHIWLFYGSDQGGRIGSEQFDCDLKTPRHRSLRLPPRSARISAHPQNRLDELLPDR
jgi:transposase